MATTKPLMMATSWEKNSADIMLLKNTPENFLDLVRTVASKELREDKYTREQCLEQLKEWIKKNYDIENCLMDENFLLRFLRGKKFSIPMAQQTILKYLNLRMRFKEIFLNLDYLDPAVNEVITNGYIFVSPFRDSKGRKVIMNIGRKFDPNKFTSNDMARAHAITYETLLDDEETQVMGVAHVADVSECGAAFISMWQLKEFATLIRWGEQSFPMRHKEIHVIKVPAAFKYVFDFCKSLLSPKLRDRIRLYEHNDEIHKIVDPHVLPKEYGGVMPMADMIELWKKELAAKRDRLLSYDKMKLLSDRGIIRRRNKVAQSDDIPGSFRKLELD